MPGYLSADGGGPKEEKKDVTSTKEKSKSNLLYTLLIFLTATAFGISGIMYSYIDQIEEGVASRDSLISRMQVGDSSYSASVKKYSEVITKYVSDCNITVDGKEISSQDLVNLINTSIEKENTCSDSLEYYKRLSAIMRNQAKEFKNHIDSNSDTSQINSAIVGLVKKYYGIAFIVTKGNNSFQISPKISRVDSALALFPYYKHNVKRDTVKGFWQIALPPKFEHEQKRKKKKP